MTRSCELNRAAWRRSSYSNGDGGECLEVAASAYVARVRDSKDVSRAPLVFPPAYWAAFVEAISKGKLSP